MVDTPENDQVDPKVEEEASPEEDSGETVEDEIAKLKDQLLRAMAEAENTRRRAQREKEDALKYGASRFARDLLSVADNLKRAIDSIPEDRTKLSPEVQKMLEGVEITERELLSAFDKSGIKKVEPMGEAFDHAYHQAMFEVETTEQPAGTVVEIMQPGYVMHDRLLRPAMVGVAKTPGETAAE